MPPTGVGLNLARIQSNNVALMFDTCVIEGVFNGTNYDKNSPIASNVPIFIQEMTPGDYPENLEIPEGKSMYRGYFPINVANYFRAGVGNTLRQNWQIVHNGNYYVIHQIIDDGTPNVNIRTVLARVSPP